MSAPLSAYVARYDGEEFRCGLYPSDDGLEVRLYSPTPRFGFDEIGDGTYVQPVDADECDVIYYSLALAQWRGLDCAICAERDDTVQVEYLGGLAPKAAEYGFDRIERGVYRRWVPAIEIRARRMHSTFIKSPD
ncbi:hypothetical protein CLV47_108132 [Antricoccus suffuscus]|uniref:Uncharacterized protein n=1 Tax=Antricoccus suffuscus TaxID=1629062 RepID=A0A2T0ZZJ3_9ACTN|nr:hypothetical protein [Antricoccus suffuscus]PRZ41773.1 hypothetical protein CLV47_108132 [Antricoccus suffuscus]